MITYKVHPTERMNVGLRIKQLRWQTDETQTEFGKRYEANKSIVGKWESGWHIPSKGRVQQMAKDFNTTVEWILYGEGERYGNI